MTDETTVSQRCPYCGKRLELCVLQSENGYYIGTACCRARESRYYQSPTVAQFELTTNTWEPPT